MRVSEHYAADLPRLLTYDLPGGETAEVIEHLRACDGCRRDLVEALADTYPPGTVLPRWFTDPPPRPAARRARRRPRLHRRAQSTVRPSQRSDAIFLCLVLLPCLLTITAAAIIALIKT